MWKNEPAFPTGPDKGLSKRDLGAMFIISESLLYRDRCAEHQYEVGNEHLDKYAKQAYRMVDALERNKGD